MLAVAWLAWAVSALKIPIWSQGGILARIGAIGDIASGGSGLAQSRDSWLSFLRENWKRLAWLEIITMVGIPGDDLGAPNQSGPMAPVSKGGEKPMDFAYLNGVLRSDDFSADRSHGSRAATSTITILALYLLGAPTLLLGVVPAFAYNLMIPTLFSLTGMGAFSAAYNVYCRAGTSTRRIQERTSGPTSSAIHGWRE